MAKHVRCHFYEDDGTPIRSTRGEGCLRSATACFYAHPSEPAWATAASTAKHVPRALRSPSPRRARSPPSRPRRNSSIERRRGIDRDSGPTRYRRDSFGHRARDLSPQSTTSFDSRHRELDPRTGGPSRSGNNPDDANMSRPSTSRFTDPKLPPSLAMNEPRPPTSKPPTIPPPPNWRSISTTNESRLANSTAKEKEMSIEEKRQVWSERVSLLSQAIKERASYSQLESNVRMLRRMISSSRFESFNDEDKASTRTQLEQAEARSKEKKQSLNGLIARLAETGFWPIVSPYDTRLFEAKYGDMKETVDGLRASITELQNSIGAVTLQHLQRRQPQMIVAAGLATDPSGRPAKRPRLSETADLSGAQAEEPVDPNLQKAITQIQDRLATFDSSLAELHNELTEHVQNVMDEFDSNLDSKLDEIMRKPMSAVNDEDFPQSLLRLRKVEEEVKTAGSEMDEIAVEVATLIIDFKKASGERDRLEAENQALKDRIALLEQTSQSNKEALWLISEENKTLSKALAEHLARPPKEELPTAEALLLRLEQPIRSKIRVEMTPLLEELQDNINQALAQHVREVQGPLAERLSQSLRAAQTISAWIEKVNQGGLPTMAPPNVPHR